MDDELVEMSIEDMITEHNDLVRRYKELSDKYESLKATLRDIMEATNECQ